MTAANTGDGLQSNAQAVANINNSEISELTFSEEVSGNKYVFQLGTVESRRAPSERWISEGTITWLAAIFVPPTGFDAGTAVLTASRAVLIAGSRGAGRYTTALMMLTKAAGSQVRKLSPDPDPDTGTLPDFDEVQEGERLLLDLSASTDESLAGVREQLESLIDKVVRSNSHLAVALPEHEDRWFGDQYRRLRVRIGAPPARSVLDRHLRARGIPFEDKELDSSALGSVYQSARVEEVSRLAGLVAEARQLDQEADFARWLSTALNAYANWSKELARELEDHQDVRWRSLLLSAALLEGAFTDAVHAAERVLLTVTGYEEEPENPLVRRGVAERLAEVGATVDHGRVRFTKLAYADAVLTHFWQEFPDLRSQLAEWVKRVPLLRRSRMSNMDRSRIADQFTEQSLRHHALRDLIVVTEQWAKAGDSRTSAMAVRTLERVVRDRAEGWRFRKQLYDWSKNRTLSPDLARVVIKLCAGVLRLDHPDQALVRLRRLARHQDHTVAAEAYEALDTLADDPQFYRRLLDRAVVTSDAELFLRVVADTSRLLPLTGDTQVRALLVDGWRVSLSRNETGTLEKWISSGAEPLVDILVEACGGQFPLLGLVCLTASDWTRGGHDLERAERRQISAMVKQKIDSAQGLGHREDAACSD